MAQLGQLSHRAYAAQKLPNLLLRESPSPQDTLIEGSSSNQDKKPEGILVLH